MRRGAVVPATVLSCNYLHEGATPRYVPAWVEVAGLIYTRSDSRSQAALRGLHEITRRHDEVICGAGRETGS